MTPPGADDDGSGVVAVLEVARRMTRYRYPKTVVFAALSGEEQGLLGGQSLAQLARDSGWSIEAVLNNDIVGNRRGMDSVANEREFRVFSEPVSAAESDRERLARRARGGEVDGPSRELARYVDSATDRYLPGFHAVMIYRLDRFGRGGDHRPFNDLGYPAVRLTEMHEDYSRQHQDVRVEAGIAYGDVLAGVDFSYLARVARVDVASLASLAWGPPPPDSVRIRGAVSPSTTVSWNPVDSPDLAGYRVYWRETTAPQWTHSRLVGAVDSVTLVNVNIDNYLFGVASVSRTGEESVVSFGR